MAKSVCFQINHLGGFKEDKKCAKRKKKSYPAYVKNRNTVSELHLLTVSFQNRLSTLTLGFRG